MLSPNRYASKFLLILLSIDAIFHESKISRRREKLRRMTNGLELGDVYGAMIKGIKAHDRDKSIFGMEVLMWVNHAERPSQADELCYALAAEHDFTYPSVGDIPSMPTLVSCG